MLWTVYFTVAFLLLIALFTWKGHSMHLFEILTVWMAVVFVDDLYVASLTLQLGWIEIPGVGETAFVRMIHLQILTPLIVVWGMSLTDRIRPFYGKWMAGAATGLVLALIRLHLSSCGVIRIVTEKGRVVDLLEALLLIAYAFAVRAAYRVLLRKDGLRL